MAEKSDVAVEEIRERLKVTVLSGDPGKQKTGLVYDESMLLHECPWDAHVECPKRISTIVDRLKAFGQWGKCLILKGGKASKEELELIHSKMWISLVQSSSLMTNSSLEQFSKGFDSVYACNETFDSALTAAGCAIELVENIQMNKIRNGFAIIRPPGHHAESEWTSGYCFFNNVAIAARYAIDRLNTKRVLIVDWDVHHGNGTQDIFYEENRVLYFSVHRYENGEYWPHLRSSSFDHTGSGVGAGHNINVPLNKPGLGDADYLAIWLRILLPIAFEFNPELVLVSAGFDASAGDVKGGMNVSPEMFAHLTYLLKPLAEEKIALILEGGYNCTVMAKCASNCLDVLFGDCLPLLGKLGPPDSTTIESILNAINVLKDRWKFLNFQPSKKEAPSLKRHVSQSPFNPPKTVTEGKLPESTVEDGVVSASGRICLSVDGTSLVYDPRMMNHYHTSPHPECPQRIAKIYERLTEEGLVSRCKEIKSRSATEDELKLIHDEGYIKKIEATMGNEQKAKQLRKKLARSYNSVFLSEESCLAAKLAVGCLLEVVDDVCSEKSRNGVAVIRPPGHHAEESEAYGFCLFDNVAIAAKYAKEKYEKKRILIFDWDVHHGNGVQESFYDTSDVLYISLHRYAGGHFFPMNARNNLSDVGEGPGEGYSVNIPWSGAMMGDAEYLMAFLNVVLPIAYEFSPDLVLVSAGFDAAAGDPLGQYKLTPIFYALMTHFLSAFAGGKVILALEGGYNLDSISASMAACVRTLLGDSVPMQSGLKACEKKAWNVIRKVVEQQSLYWESLNGYTVVLEPYRMGLAVPMKKGKNQEVTPEKTEEEELSVNSPKSGKLPGNIDADSTNIEAHTSAKRIGSDKERTGLIYDMKMLEHRCLWGGQIENPERLTRILEKCADFGLLDRCVLLEPRLADPWTELTMCHSEEIIRKLEACRSMNETELENLSGSFEDVYLCQESYDAALLSAGCALTAMEAVVTKKVKNSIALIRPPGHHASRDTPCGFCLFNNVSLCARKALTKYGMKRVMIVDWDVHAGQGTQYEFETDPRVLFVSLHRYDKGAFWPNLSDTNWDSIGKGSGLGYTVNIPTCQGFGDSEYAAAFSHLVFPLAAEFNPELILISSGFDAAIGDCEGELRLTPAIFGHLTRSLCAFSNGKVCAILEGGYFMESLASGAALTLKSLLFDSIPPLNTAGDSIDHEFARTLVSIATKLGEYWQCCKDWTETLAEARDMAGLQKFAVPEKAEYFGVRNVPIPWPTRNAYPARPDSVEEAFKKEVQDILDSYRFRDLSKSVQIIFNKETTEQHFDRCKDSLECPERLKSLLKYLKKKGAMTEDNSSDSTRMPTQHDLIRVHCPRMIEKVKKISDGWYLGDEDEKFPTFGCDSTYSAALVSAGCGLEAVDWVMRDNSQSALVLARPHGHHASRDSFNGFCFFNNVTIAAEYARDAYGARKILIFDWDIHFGDGTAKIFEEDPSVLYVSLHRSAENFYPPCTEENDSSVRNVGKGPGRGFTLNLGWKEGGKTDSDYFFAFEHVVFPVCREFNPDLVLVSSGYDGGNGDPIGGCCLTPEIFAYMTHKISGLANGNCVVFLEGGYSLDFLRKGVLGTVQALSGAGTILFCSAISQDVRNTVAQVLNAHKPYWKSLNSLVDF